MARLTRYMHCSEHNAVDSGNSRKEQSSRQTSALQPLLLASKDACRDKNVVEDS